MNDALPLEDDELLTHLGQDVHFLSRLERVTYGQTELALRLYRDPALVRAILADPTCPREYDRIAIAIDPSPAPPHIVVARSGAFVTCLGSGMDVGHTPAISWERLEHHRRRADLRAAQRERAEEVFKEQGPRELIDRLFTAGAQLSREEFQQLMAVEPLLQRVFMEHLIRYHSIIYRTGLGVARLKRPRPSDERRLRVFWNAFFGMNHLILLASLGGRRSFEVWDHIREERGIDIFDGLFLRLPFFGYGPTALRSLWAVGLAGKIALPSLKRLAASAPEFMDWVAPVLGLINVGLRHQRLRAEALGAMSVARLPARLRSDPAAQQWVSTLQKLLRGEFEGLGHPFEQAEPALRSLAGHVLETLECPEVETQYDRERFRDDPLILTRLANAPFDFLEHPQGYYAVLFGTAALAHLPAEHFYFPASEVHRAPSFSPMAAMALAEFARPEGPVRVEQKIGRNQSCPCGSGKKHKKCCGAAIPFAKAS
ncbi:MAG TPA: SEC-C metal-binding domain-containing protein [Polyangia bacterium]|nr:SEC-C metal-binding domain-containing protein [Polyangia bacterium]